MKTNKIINDINEGKPTLRSGGMLKRYKFKPRTAKGYLVVDFYADGRGFKGVVALPDGDTKIDWDANGRTQKGGVDAWLVKS